jgi:hypothetical protein
LIAHALGSHQRVDYLYSGRDSKAFPRLSFDRDYVVAGEITKQETEFSLSIAEVK